MSRAPDDLLCPSAQPDMEEARIIGVVAGTPAQPQVAYLGPGVEIDPAVKDRLGGLQATHVFRFAAKCEQTQCAHFDGSRCSLVKRIVRHLPEVVDALPVCQIRASCRWFAEEGGAACRRCPQVVTLIRRKEDLMSQVAAPEPLTDP